MLQVAEINIQLDQKTFSVSLLENPLSSSPLVSLDYGSHPAPLLPCLYLQRHFSALTDSVVLEHSRF